MEVVERHAMFGGEMLTFTHLSASCGFAMRCRAFTPPGFSSEAPATWPCLVALGGLTASEVNFATKVATVQRAAAERGLVVIFPDASPLGQQDDPHPLLGEGASYYVDATEAGWGNWKMFSYVTKDLPDLVRAIVAFLRSDAFVSCSAFAPVSNPSAIGPGTAPAWRAFSEYLGGGDAEAPDDAPWRDAWRSYDACELLKRYDGPPKKLLVDQGAADPKLKVLGSESGSKTRRTTRSS
ncbi:S-formylglutathione hydrolase [Aureococcus anophagefferens]|nr:S-formylglutathione hydrolase [Aureococcus anophagefferens]